MAFQESITITEYDQVRDLLGPAHQIAHETLGSVSASDYQGTAIASRWPIGKVRELDSHMTPRTADFPCTNLVVEVTAPEPIGPLLFVNHLPSWQRSFELERELQTVAAARLLEELIDGRNLHVELAGDLDAVPDAASIRFWTGRQSLGNMSVCH